MPQMPTVTVLGLDGWLFGLSIVLSRSMQHLCDVTSKFLISYAADGSREKSTGFVEVKSEVKSRRNDACKYYTRVPASRTSVSHVAEPDLDQDHVDAGWLTEHRDGKLSGCASRQEACN